MDLSCNMLWQDFSTTVFFSLKHYIFIIKHISSEMLSFLHRWDYCLECEFDTDAKTENYYRHDGEQLGFYKNSTYQNTGQDVFVIFLLEETKNSNLFDKNCAQEYVKCHIQHKESWLRWILIEQVSYYFPFVFPEIYCNSEKVIMMHSKKMKAKCMKVDVWKSFFVNLQVGISQLH